MPFILGEGPLKDLALALFVGMISGAYSSIFIATPLLAQLKEREPDMQKLAKRVLARRAKEASGRRGAGRIGGGSSRSTRAAVRAGGRASRADDDLAEAGGPDAPAPAADHGRRRAQPPIVNRPLRPTSDGAAKRPQPQHKPRSQRKK